MAAAPSAISVVIPAFQRRAEVMGAIDSVLAQELRPLDIVLVDDGSTDGTADAVTARYGDRVQLVEQQNRGPSAARNAGVRVAAGDVIAFLDSDDRWLPHHLAVISNLLARHPQAVLVGTHAGYCFGDDVPSAALLTDFAEALLLSRIEVGVPSSVAVRREAFEAAGGFDEDLRYAEDNQLFVLLALDGPFALISATTLERGHSRDSLAVEGRRTGAFIGFLERSADRALAALELSPRSDADALRTAARARRALGAVAASLARGEPPQLVRQHVDELRRLRPDEDPEPYVLYQVPWIVPQWERAEERQRVATTLRQAVRS